MAEVNNYIKKVTTLSLFLLIVTYLAFISLGLPDGLLGIAWPFMSARSGVPLDSLGILLISFTIGYLSTSSTSGKIVKIISLGTLLAISCLITSLSLLTYAFNNSWHILIIASFFLGSGGGAIDSSINTFAASRFKASTVTWLHAFYGVGATTGPLIITFMLSKNLHWSHGYVTVALIQLSLCIVFLFTRNRWKIASSDEEHYTPSSYSQTIKLPIAWIFMLIFFLYTGLEQGFGQWLFTILTRSRKIGEEEAGLLTSIYWGSLTVGRIIVGIVLTQLPTHKVLNVAISEIMVGLFLFMSDLTSTSNIIAIIVIGLANAPVFPGLIAITPIKIGKEHMATAIGVQISMAMLGGALLPGFAGFLSDEYGLEVISKIYCIAAVMLATLYFITFK